MGRHGAVEVLGDAAARDVGQGVHGGARREGPHHGAGVDGGGRQQSVRQRLASQLGAGLQQPGVVHAVGHGRAHEGVAVGVDAARGQAEDDVALAHVVLAQHFGRVHHAHAEAGEVVVVRGHDAGVLGHLAADEGAAGLAAPRGDAAHHLGHLLGAELAHRHVVQEEQRLGAGDHHVVGAHGHEVLAHGVVAAQTLGQGQLGTHAVGAAHEHRVLHGLE